MFESRSARVARPGRALRGKEGRHRPRNATSRAWQCLRSYGFSDRERDEKCALAIAWKHAPATHARRSRTPSRTPLLLSEKASFRTCPPLTLGSLVPSPKRDRHERHDRTSACPRKEEPVLAGFELTPTAPLDELRKRAGERCSPPPPDWRCGSGGQPARCGPRAGSAGRAPASRLGQRPPVARRPALPQVVRSGNATSARVGARSLRNAEVSGGRPLARRRLAPPGGGVALGDA